MPNCYTLTRKGEKEPMKLVQIDELICRKFGASVHPTQWYFQWHNIIGFKLALGQSWDEIISSFVERIEEKKSEKTLCAEDIAYDIRLKEIAEYLRDTFDVNSWYQLK